MLKISAPVLFFVTSKANERFLIDDDTCLVSPNFAKCSLAQKRLGKLKFMIKKIL